jgi:hypothetical protein
MKQDKQNKRKMPVPTVPVTPKVAPLFNWAPQIKYTILLLIGFFLYVNSLQNEYALDDGGVIIANQYVQEGFKGIGSIMTKDAFSSYLEKMHAGQQLSGGRYRPLSIVVFAIQQGIFGNSPFIRHLFNVVFFLLTIFALYYFLSNYLLKHVQYGDDMAFVSTLLFVIHPIHTEVVANIKSLDEILSLLFILCAFIFGLKYIDENKTKYLVIALVSYLLALLAKEYGITLIVLLPMLFYLYPGVQKDKVLKYFLPYLGVICIYGLLRVSAVGAPFGHPAGKLLNNQMRIDPYYFATHAQKLATEWYCLGRYVCLLFFPYPLSSDYSYNQIPYHTFSNPSVWMSIFVYIAIIIWGIQLLRKKNVMAFAVFFYLLNLAICANFIINVGAMLGERFAYHSSVGFVVLLTYGIFYAIQKLPAQTKKASLTALLSVLILLCGAEVISRNPDWKNNTTLFLADIKNAPNSSFINNNAAACYINLAGRPENAKRAPGLLDTALHCLFKAAKTDNTFPDPYINLGLAYYFESKLDSAKYYWDTVQGYLYPNHPDLQRFRPMLAKAYLSNALAYGGAGKTKEAIILMYRGISEDPENADLWYNLGGAYYTIHNIDSAKIAWMKTLQLKPDYVQAQGGLNAISQQHK